MAEDDDMLRSVVVDELAMAGFIALQAAKAADAIAILQVRAPEIDALFTDIHMPGHMNGLELARFTARQWPWIALLISSGLPPPKRNDMPTGSFFLPKPYNLTDVAFQIKTLLDANLKQQRETVSRSGPLNYQTKV